MCVCTYVSNCMYNVYVPTYILRSMDGVLEIFGSLKATLIWYDCLQPEKPNWDFGEAKISWNCNLVHFWFISSRCAELHCLKKIRKKPSSQSRDFLKTSQPNLSLLTRSLSVDLDFLENFNFHALMFLKDYKHVFTQVMICTSIKFTLKLYT